MTAYRNKYLEMLKAEKSKNAPLRPAAEIDEINFGNFGSTPERSFRPRSMSMVCHVAGAQVAARASFGVGRISIPNTIRKPGNAGSVRRPLRAAGRVISAGCLIRCAMTESRGFRCGEITAGSIPTLMRRWERERVLKVLLRSTLACADAPWRGQGDRCRGELRWRVRGLD
jgi:hypothetical protein